MRKAKNILILQTDQHRWDCIGTYGNAEVKTPVMDALAKDGVRYNNCFCTHPVCTPSRYSFLSGQYVSRHGGWSNHCTLRPEIPTFPRTLAQAGWQTAAVGKMHFTPTYLDVGFQRMCLAEQNGPGRWEDDYHAELMREGLVDENDLIDQVEEFRAGADEDYFTSCGAMHSNLPDHFHSTSWIGRKAREALSKWDARESNLLMVSFIKPHHPFDPPRSFLDRYDPEVLTPLAGWSDTLADVDSCLDEGFFPNRDLTKETLRRVMAAYYGAISHIDQTVGDLIRCLKEQGLYEDTMIIVNSDHGEYMGYHHLLLKSNHLYDPLARVPLLIKYPGGDQAGGVHEGLFSSVDVTTEILTAAGVEVPESMAGIPIRQTSQGRARVVCEAGNGRRKMIRTRSHKLLLNGGICEDLFFDLDLDPLERINRLNDSGYRSIIENLRQEADRFGREQSGGYETLVDESAPQIKRPDISPETLRTYFRNRMKSEPSALENTP